MLGHHWRLGLFEGISAVSCCGILFFCLCLVCACGASSEEKQVEPVKVASRQKPNIVILLADDMGWNDVGFNNPEIVSPNIDRLAAEGASMNRFYVSNTCTPSRVALMTGRYPGRLGLTNGVLTPERRDGLPRDEFLLPEMLASAGYEERACFGKWHLGHAHVKFHPLNQGFTHFYGHYSGNIDYFEHTRRRQRDWHRNFESVREEGYSTDLLAAEAVKFIENASEDSPFFIYLPFNAPHEPLQATDEDLLLNGFDPAKGVFADGGGVKKKATNTMERGRGNSKRQTYKAMVTGMDRAIGAVMKALKKKGVADNTLVIFYSDNGASMIQGGSNLPLKGAKGSLFEGGVRVPAVFWWPARIAAGSKFDEVHGHVDIWKTLAELTDASQGQKKPDGVDVLATIIDGSKDDKRSFYLGRKALVTPKWKLVNNQLFAIDKDPLETKDLSEEQPEIKKKMRGKLRRLREKIEKGIEPSMGFPVQDNWEMPDHIVPDLPGKQDENQ